MVDGFKKKYPEVNVIKDRVAGGGGMVMQAQIKTMIMAGQSPDTFQVLLGQDNCSNGLTCWSRLTRSGTAIRSPIFSRTW